MAEKTQGVTVSKAKPLVAKIDFTNVTEGSGIRPKQLPPGEYAASIKDVKAGNSKKTGTPQWCFLIVPDKHPGATYPYYCQLTADQAWKIRQVLVAIGVSVPKSVKTIDASKLIGKKLGIILEDDEYEGKLKSVIDSLIPLSEVDEGDTPAAEDEDDDEPEDSADEPEDDPAGDDDDELDLDDL
ncbi:hypothetical protein SEA_AXYM_38 [Gordonia phage Axym]|uniref:Uncharacterized protein n=2 Tax=Emalynvirus cozz TaxID=2560490 RepID=A0A5Q2WHC4_9CAUD|nr:hypothetical protein SEA_AXYM_38 [Gordonia phage Axym]QOP65296.1 hypothetical protein SEA_BURNSEY_38 [Gordonia phage Burnsey]